MESDLNKLREEKLAILKKEELDRQVLTSKLLSTRNFLEDSKILFSIIKENTFAMLFWLSLTLLLFTLEMLVLINKIGEPKNDYDKRLDWELDQNSIAKVFSLMIENKILESSKKFLVDKNLDIRTCLSSSSFSKWPVFPLAVYSSHLPISLLPGYWD